MYHLTHFLEARVVLAVLSDSLYHLHQSLYHPGITGMSHFRLGTKLTLLC